MPSIKRFRQRTDTRNDDYDNDEIALVPCDPYVVLGHVKTRSIPLLSYADDPEQTHVLIEPHVPLEVTINNLPVSDVIKKALFVSETSSVFTALDKVKYLKFLKEAKVKKGDYVFLTICSFQSDDIQRPNAEFLTWTPEEELLRYQGGKDACIAYVECNNLATTARLNRLKQTYSSVRLQRILEVHSQRMRTAHRLMNDAATFIPYTGQGYVLGKGDRRNRTSAQRDRAVRVFHKQMLADKTKQAAAAVTRVAKTKVKAKTSVRSKTRAERARARNKTRTKAAR